jgi:hypothetical protein
MSYRICTKDPHATVPLPISHVSHAEFIFLRLYRCKRGRCARKAVRSSVGAPELIGFVHGQRYFRLCGSDRPTGLGNRRNYLTLYHPAAYRISHKLDALRSGIHCGKQTCGYHEQEDLTRT